MNKKSFKFVFLFIAIVVLVLGGVLGYRKYTDESKLRGQYTFARAKQEIKSIGKIVMTTPSSGSITIYRDVGSWRFKEAADYFVNMKMLSNFYTMVNDSVIISVQKVSNDVLKQNNLLSAEESENSEGEGTEIAVYDDDGKLLNDVIIGTRDGNNATYMYARQKGKKYMYVVSNIGRFSGEAQTWIPYPLLRIENPYVNSIEVDGIFLNRQQLTRLTYDAMRISKMLDSVSFINYQGIAKKEDFFSTLQNVEPKEIKFNMIGGFVYVLRVYYVNDYYWLEIKLAADSIAHKDIWPFVEDNQVYFKDWVFQLFDEQGELLYGSE